MSNKVKRRVRISFKSPFGEGTEEHEEGNGNPMWDDPLVQAWLTDLDWQTITLSSTNLLKTYTLTKLN